MDKSVPLVLTFALNQIPGLNALPTVLSKMVAKASEEALLQTLIDVKADCFYSGACFAAGTPLRVPGGWAAIEDLEVGSVVLSRDEHDPAGAVEPKLVEEVFKRFSAVWELRAGGRVMAHAAFDSYTHYAFASFWHVISG